MPKHPSTSTITELEAMGDRLKLLRMATGLNQIAFAKDLKVTRQSWSNYETGYARIGIDTALALLRKYKVSLDWIYTGDESMMPAKILDPIRHLREMRRLHGPEAEDD